MPDNDTPHQELTPTDTPAQESCAVEPNIYFSTGCRIVVSIDLPTDDPEEAYRQLYRFLATAEEHQIQWESTDEWFDNDGNYVCVDRISEIRLKIIEEYERAKLRKRPT